MIDREGYRHGVGIIIVNSKRQLFLAKRIGKPAWQFPQGGMQENELPIDAMYRELYEEIGLKREHVELLAETKSWLRYRLPKKLIRYNSKPLCYGQKQKWFLLKIKSDTLKFDLLASHSPEFDSWAWVSYWYPLTQVIAFKKRVYSRALKEFAHIVLSKKFWDYF